METDRDVQQVQMESSREFSVTEENSIYYTAGYVVRKLLKKFTKRSDETANVTEFAKRGLIHASDFSTLRRCNSASVGPTALIFGSRILL